MNKPDDVSDHIDEANRKNSCNNMIMKRFAKCSIEKKMMKIEDATRDGWDEKYNEKPEFDSIWNVHIDD